MWTAALTAQMFVVEVLLDDTSNKIGKQIKQPSMNVFDYIETGKAWRDSEPVSTPAQPENWHSFTLKFSSLERVPSCEVF